ncbi:MAG TPA: polymer-forming cytoskeletal protein [Candidatus Omnitrophota bacterium]|nr:polymer-forming cytoskeletal protein [Candidatus Omnitrophota bacterium]HPS37753.1 polymer-forming cytoskeletal protein [Candidatus Omnitrophota bacterium]
MAQKKKDEIQEKILDVDASMQGTISFKDPVNLRINGSFEGKLDTRGNLTIGENAKVAANIHGDNIVIAGKVTGDIVATRSLAILGSATLKGNVTTPRMSMVEGAVLQGHVGMQGATSADGVDVFLTLKDVAQYLEVESKVIEDWAHSKKIPARFENGNWIFIKAEVDQWIQQERARV